MIIANPDNGPVSLSSDEWTVNAYKNCINYARSKGARVIGYVKTKIGYPNIYAYRTEAAVKADIDLWESDWTVDGIFIDEVTNRWPNLSFDSTAGALAFYNKITSYVLGKSTAGQQWYAVQNPGSVGWEEMVTSQNSDRVIQVVYEKA